MTEMKKQYAQNKSTFIMRSYKRLFDNDHGVDK